MDPSRTSPPPGIRNLGRVSPGSGWDSTGHSVFRDGDDQALLNSHLVPRVSTFWALTPAIRFCIREMKSYTPEYIIARCKKESEQTNSDQKVTISSVSGFACLLRGAGARRHSSADAHLWGVCNLTYPKAPLRGRHSKGVRHWYFDSLGWVPR